MWARTGSTDGPLLTPSSIKVLLPTDAQEICFKRSIKIYIKTAPTYFGVITIIREHTI
jgi:hypothetical protein